MNKVQKLLSIFSKNITFVFRVFEPFLICIHLLLSFSVQETKKIHRNFHSQISHSRFLFTIFDVQPNKEILGQIIQFCKFIKRFTSFRTSPRFRFIHIIQAPMFQKLFVLDGLHCIQWLIRIRSFQQCGNSLQ